MARTPGRHTLPEWLIASCGVWQVGLGLFFIFVRPALLPEDVRYLGVEPGVLQTTAPGLTAWLGKVFTVMGGFMAGVGVLFAFVGWTVMPTRAAGTAVVLAVAGALTLALMSAVNFALNSDYRWLLLVPPLLWAVALVLYAADRDAGSAGQP